MSDLKSKINLLKKEYKPQGLKITYRVTPATKQFPAIIGVLITYKKLYVAFNLSEKEPEKDIRQKCTEILQEPKTI